MTKCFGLLSSGQAEEPVTVGLWVGDDLLTAAEEGGATWNIPLARVHLVGWANDELRLELAGTEVSFTPDDPGKAHSLLVLALLAHEQRGAALAGATTAPPLVPTSSPQTPELLVDLTGDAGVLPPPAVATTPVVAPRVRRRRGWLVWVILVAAILVGAFFIAQRGSQSDPETAAREAVVAGGFPPIDVSVDGGQATLSGAVPSEDVAVAVAAAIAGIDGIDTVTSNLEVTGPTATTVPDSTPAGPVVDAAGEALADAGYPDAVLRLDGATATVSGVVPAEFDRRAAASVLVGVSGIEQVDNQLVVAGRPDATVEADARAALTADGFDTVDVAIEGGVATLAGVVPRDGLADGFFQYSAAVESVVVRVEGVAGIRDRLQVAGDEATLRRQLRELTDAAPVVFVLGRADLSASAMATLDAAADIIQAQPGLRVLIAGHTDTTGSAGFNEELSGERAGAVRTYLIEHGIAANRLRIVAYGELFPTAPGAQPGDRRVEFEVAG